MNHDREIVAAALRWSTANAKRLEIGAAKRRATETLKATDFGSGVGLSDRDFWARAKAMDTLHFAESSAAAQLTPARRAELAALRALAKVCAKARALQVDDADMVIDAVEVLRLT